MYLYVIICVIFAYIDNLNTLSTAVADIITCTSLLV
jgi:hypothetical protein